jgi:tRNA/tmRNA/rRNA uracil-C5-methylase (TrmA/RlmC/RlmD family)
MKPFLSQNQKKLNLEKVLKKYLSKNNYFKFINSPRKKRYRNNILFSFGYDKLKQMRIGPMSTIEGVKIVEKSQVNPNASQLSLDICSIVWEWVDTFSELYVVKYPKFEGFWRHIHIKENQRGEFIIIFRFNDYEKWEIDWKSERGDFIKYLKSQSLKKGYILKAIYYQICEGTKEPQRVDNFYRLYFEGELIQGILGYNFVIHPGCFFQVNTQLAKILYSVVQSFYTQPGDILLDLCCGVGVFGLLLSKYFNEIYGIDNNPCNIEMVEQNCILNKVKNYKYLLGNVEDIVDKVLVSGRKYSIVVNPPRRGLYSNFIEYINSKREYVIDLVYVSCNMKSLKRDMDELGEYWEVEKVVPLDQFPNTNHCEIIVKMKNKMF